MTTKKDKKERDRYSKIKRIYGLSQEDWLKILDEQDGKCFICRRKLKIGGKSTRFSAHTDHCHKTGRIRGLLCRRCNMDIVPRFEKDTKAAINLHVYLTRTTNYGYINQ